MGIFDFFKSNKPRYNKKTEQGQQYQSVYAVSDDIDVNVDLSEELEDHFLMVHEEDSCACDDMEYLEEHDDCEWEEDE